MRTVKHEFTTWAVALATACTVWGCASSQARLFNGLYGATITQEMVPAAFPPRAKALMAGDWQVRFDGNGHYQVLKADKVLVEGVYTLTANQIVLIDKGGEMSCSNGGSEVTGTYSWTQQGDTISFKAVQDPCEGRTAVLVAQPFKKKK